MSRGSSGGDWNNYLGIIMLFPKDVPYRNVPPQPYPAAIRPRRIRRRRRPSPNRVSKALCLLEHEVFSENPQTHYVKLKIVRLSKVTKRALRKYHSLKLSYTL